MAEIITTKRWKYKNGEKTNEYSWQYRFEIGVGADGKRQWASKSGFKTKTEALDAARKAMNCYENVGEVVKPTEMTLDAFLDYWIEHSCKDNCKPITVAGYQKKIRLYINNEVATCKLKVGEKRRNLAIGGMALGKYRIKNITNSILEEFLKMMYNEGFSLNTISSVRGIFTKAFAYAYKNHYITFSPAFQLEFKTVNAPKKATRTEPHVYIEPEQWNAIIERFPRDTVAYLPLLIGYRCGLRLGETYALTWDDIDLDKKTLTVNRQVQWHQGSTRTDNGKKSKHNVESLDDSYWYFSEPKYKSYRVIDIDDELVEILRAEKEQQEKDRKDYRANMYTRYFVEHPLITDGIVPDMAMPTNPISENSGNIEIRLVMVRNNYSIGNRAAGTYITPRTMQHTSSIIHHQLGFKEFDYHSLRHTHATMLRANGAPDIYVSKRLGHKKIDTTLNIYSNHLTDAVKEQGNAILFNMF